MKTKIQQERIWAVQRFLSGEKPESIYVSLRRSRAWLYKWVDRYAENDASWSKCRSKRPLNPNSRTPKDIEDIVKMVRLNLYNRDLFHGAQAIQWEMEDRGVEPLPSLRTINRILSRNDLTHRQTGRYQPKGTAYPKLPSLFPNQTHQADFVGPCYLKGALRFYALNTVDVATARCGLYASRSSSGQSVLEGFWSTWKRLGMPVNVQVDNAMSFFGSPTHPRGMGPLIRLCLHHGVEPWFIPMGEPWRNGVVEKFNDHYEQKFLGKVMMTTEKALIEGTLAFEHKHNSRYRYSKLGGQTPLKALEASKTTLRFPAQENAPCHRMKKPETGRYHIVRFIRSNMKLDIFGELFPVAPELVHEYVVATVEVEDQKLKVVLNKTQVDEIDYQLF